jgi:hypothetical protein
MMDFGNYILRHYRWTAWKAIAAAKVLVHQYEQAPDGTYTIWGYDGPEVHVCAIWSGSLPAGILAGDPSYDQSVNDTACVDFETSWKATANAPIEPKAKDGRPATRQTTANRTTNFNLRVFSFYTARSGSVHNVNPVTDADWGDIAYKMYDVSGSLVTDPTLSGSVVKTVIDWEPHYNYEIIGGYMDIPTALKDGATDEWFLSGIGVPDLPPQMYGSVPYISEVNLEAITAQRVVSDGKAISYLPYKYAGYPTNKLRFTVKHPAGAQERFQMYLEHFV